MATQRSRGPRPRPTRIAFQQRHLADARARLTVIALTEDAWQRSEEERVQATLRSRQLELTHEYLLSDLTWWLARQYRLHPERGEQWELDLEHMELRRVDAPDHHVDADAMAPSIRQDAQQSE